MFCGLNVRPPEHCRHNRGMVKSRWRWLAEWIRHDDGDVPGWVLITLMTAGLVLLLWGVAGPALTAVFEQAIERVSSF